MERKTWLVGYRDFSIGMMGLIIHEEDKIAERIVQAAKQEPVEQPPAIQPAVWQTTNCQAPIGETLTRTDDSDLTMGPVRPNLNFAAAPVSAPES